MHRLGLRLYRSARGDVMTPDVVPAICFAAAAHWEGGHPVEVWNGVRDGPLPLPPPGDQGARQTPVRLAPAAGAVAPPGDMVARCQQLPWGPGADSAHRSRSPRREEGPACARPA